MKIEKLEIDHINGNYITVQQRLNQVIEALNSITVEKIREPEGKQVSYPRDEKREKMAQDANYKNMPEYGEFWRNVKRSSIEEPKSGTHVGILLGDDEGVESVTYDGKEIYSEEPKSTLREDIKEILCEAMYLKPEYLDPTGNKDTDKIISLFKDTLLKEVKKAEPLRLQGESTDFTQGQEWTMRQIKQIIKNL